MKSATLMESGISDVVNSCSGGDKNDWYVLGRLGTQGGGWNAMVGEILKKINLHWMLMFV
jgi:hypothetical protein